MQGTQKTSTNKNLKNLINFSKLIFFVSVVLTKNHQLYLYLLVGFYHQNKTKELNNFIGTA